MTAVISFAKKESVRFPGKNMALLDGVPLFEYTARLMGMLPFKGFVLTDWEELAKLAINYNLHVIPLPRYIVESDDIRLNYFAHRMIQADEYILLQPTQPIRDYDDIMNMYQEAKAAGCQSAYTIDNGDFYYYTKEQLYTGALIDSNSKLLRPITDIDIDTPEDLERAKEYIKESGWKQK